MPTVFDNSLREVIEHLAAGAGADEVEVLAQADDAAVVRVGDEVVKAHARETDEASLAARVGAAHRLAPVLLAPSTLTIDRRADRLMTRWPVATPLAHDEATVPWAPIGALLARLHAADVASVDPDRRLPEAGGPRRLERAVQRLRAAPVSAERTVVLDAHAALPPAARAHASHRHLVHGDVHLGQVVRSADGHLRLLDVDELGVGDPAWDLARPAAWYAGGLMPEAAWRSFLGGYLDAGGCAVDADDPWPALDGPARAMVVQAAARAVVRAGGPSGLDATDRALLATCSRLTLAARGERR